MSKISLKPNVNGTADFTIESPDSNTDRTLTLPDEAGTVLTTATDIESQVKTATNATGSAPIYSCRAWVNFDGTGTVSIRESGNVSSITDNGTGDYTVNFATAMPDANYTYQATSSNDNIAVTFVDFNQINQGIPSTTSAPLEVVTPGGVLSDRQFINASFFR